MPGTIQSLAKDLDHVQLHAYFNTLSQWQIKDAQECIADWLGDQFIIELSEAGKKRQADNYSHLLKTIRLLRFFFTIELSSNLAYANLSFLIQQPSKHCNTMAFYFIASDIHVIYEAQQQAWTKTPRAKPIQQALLLPEVVLLLDEDKQFYSKLISQELRTRQLAVRLTLGIFTIPSDLHQIICDYDLDLHNSTRFIPV